MKGKAATIMVGRNTIHVEEVTLNTIRQAKETSLTRPLPRRRRLGQSKLWQTMNPERNRYEDLRQRSVKLQVLVGVVWPTLFKMSAYVGSSFEMIKKE